MDKLKGKQTGYGAVHGTILGLKTTVNHFALIKCVGSMVRSEKRRLGSRSPCETHILVAPHLSGCCLKKMDHFWVLPGTACGFRVSSTQLHEGHFKGQLCVVFLSMMFFTSAVFGHTLQTIPVLPGFERTREKTAGLRNAMSFQTCTGICAKSTRNM